MLLLSGLHHQNVYSSPHSWSATVHRTLYTCTFCIIKTGLALIGLMGKFSFWFLNCYIGQPSQPVSVKLPSSSCLEPWPHPGKGTLPMPDQAGKLSSERNGGYTRLKGPFHPAEGQGVNCPLSGPSGSGPAWEEKLFPQGNQCSCTVCVHITAELVPSSLFIQCCTCVHFIALLVS